MYGIEKNKYQDKYPLLFRTDSVEDLRHYDIDSLKQLSSEITGYIIDVIESVGGHLGSPLGVVDLTIALHKVFDTPRDKILWDVGHQAHCHKIITGRRDAFPTIKQQGGLSGYPDFNESEFDLFKIGHSSTSVSQAMAYAIERDRRGGDEHVIAVIGDGASTAGMAYEAINHIGSLQKRVIVVLNDNKMSISKNVGALSRSLNKMVTNHRYYNVRKAVDETMKKALGEKAERWYQLLTRTRDGIKNILMPGIIFEELGFFYVGPVDGHNMSDMISLCESIKKIDKPVLMHVVTEKGRGHSEAKEDPYCMHASGVKSVLNVQPAPKKETFTQVFSKSILNLKQKYPQLVAITAAMSSGVGLEEFSKAYPKDFFDVGIAEQHAVTLAGGMAKSGLKVIMTLYATFLQRAHDQVIHDVYLQKAPVVFCIDRWGIVGEDGASHSGVFPIAQLRSLPGGAICLPKNADECEEMMALSLAREKEPVFIGYPKGEAVREKGEKVAIDWGKSEVLCEGKDLVVFTAGPLVYEALKLKDQLHQSLDIDVAVVNLRFVKPLDEECILSLVKKVPYVVSLEETAVIGGVGTAIMELWAKEGLAVQQKNIGVPDEFVVHGKRQRVLEDLGIVGDKLYQDVKSWYEKIQLKVLT